MIVPFFNLGPLVIPLIAAGASIVSAIGSAISSHKSNKTNRKIAKETNDANAAINQSQLDYNWETLHYQNEYNNPSNQRQRLVDAGLNPIYYGLDGNSSASGNAFSPIASQQASPTIPTDFSGIGDSLLRLAEVRNLEADTQQKQSQSGLSDEQAENLRQLRSGMLTIQGQQIQLNVDQHELNSAKRDEILSSVDSIRQSIVESDQRIENYRSEVSYRKFQERIQQAQFDLDEKYKNGLLTIQELNLALGWFDAYTSRMNASTNYYNAETNRMNVKGNLYDLEKTRPYRQGFMNSISHFNRTNAVYVRDKNKREQGAYTIEQVSRAADAWTSVIDAAFHLSDKSLDRASSVLNFVPN